MGEIEKKLSVSFSDWYNKARSESSDGGKFISPKEYQEAVDIFLKVGISPDLNFEPLREAGLPDEYIPINCKDGKGSFYASGIISNARSEAYEKLPFCNLTKEDLQKMNVTVAIKGMFRGGDSIQIWTISDSNYTIKIRISETHDDSGSKCLDIIASDKEGRMVKLSEDQIKFLRQLMADYREKHRTIKTDDMEDEINNIPKYLNPLDGILPVSDSWPQAMKAWSNESSVYFSPLNKNKKCKE